MAGDWIKVEKATPSKPEVLAMSAALGIDPDCCFGKLVRVWSWFDDHTTDGNATGNGLSVTPALLDRLVSVTGFGQAMVDVGWLVSDGNAVAMPHFDYHTSESAKQRALTAKRVAKHKDKTNATGNASSVTTGVTCALPREEKRREDIRSAAARHAAAVEGCSDIRKIDLTPLMREVEPADLGGLANGSLLGSLTPDVIADPSLMVNWFRQQLSHEEPVTGSTGLDLFLVLAKTLDIKRRSNRLKNPAGVLVQALRSGEWLSNRECLREAKRLMDEAEATGELKWHLNGTEVDHV